MAVAECALGKLKPDASAIVELDSGRGRSTAPFTRATRPCVPTTASRTVSAPRHCRSAQSASADAAVSGITSSVPPSVLTAKPASLGIADAAARASVPSAASNLTTVALVITATAMVATAAVMAATTASSSTGWPCLRLRMPCGNSVLGMACLWFRGSCGERGLRLPPVPIGSSSDNCYRSLPVWSHIPP